MAAARLQKGLMAAMAVIVLLSVMKESNKKQKLIKLNCEKRLSRRRLMPLMVLRGGSDGAHARNGGGTGAAELGGEDEFQIGENVIQKKENEDNALNEHIKILAERIKEELKLGEEGEELIKQKKDQELLELIRRKRGEMNDISDGKEVGSAEKIEEKPEVGGDWNIQKESGYAREMLEECTAKVLVEKIGNPEKLASIKISGKSLSPAAAAVFASKLLNCTNLETVDISDCIAGRPEDEAMKTLETLSNAFVNHSKITSVMVSDNALGDTGVRRISPLLKDRNLKDLHLANTGMQVDGLQLVSQYLGSLENLETLELQRNLITTEGAVVLGKMLEKAPNLRIFRAFGSRISADGGKAILKGLLATSKLAVLDLSNNVMGEGITEALCAVIAQQEDLKVVKLGGTGLSADMISRIVFVLASSAPNLEEIDISCAGITVMDIVALIEKMHPLTKIKSIHLSENQLGTEGLMYLADAMQNGSFPNLQHLDLTDNQIGSHGALMIAKACAQRKNFERLELDCNTISEWCITYIQDIFRKARLGENVLGEMDLNDPEMDQDDPQEDDPNSLLDSAINEGERVEDAPPQENSESAYTDPQLKSHIEELQKHVNKFDKEDEDNEEKMIDQLREAMRKE